MFQKEDSKEEYGEEDKPVEAFEWNDQEEDEDEEEDDEVFEDAVENTVGHLERKICFVLLGFFIFSSSNLCYSLFYPTESDRVVHQLSAEQSGLAGLCGQQQPCRHGEGAEGKV